MGKLRDALKIEVVAQARANPRKLRIVEPLTPRDATQQRLLAALRVEGLPDRILGLEHGDIGELSDNALRAYVRMLREEITRQSGEVLIDETAPMLCAHCGPAWTTPDVAAVLPLVDGWPRALGCPWCFHERQGANVPRPLVACGECKFFVRDAINPFAGMGQCGAGLNPERPWPGVKHKCGGFRPGPARGG